MVDVIITNAGSPSSNRTSYRRVHTEQGLEGIITAIMTLTSISPQLICTCRNTKSTRMDLFVDKSKSGSFYTDTGYILGWEVKCKSGIKKLPICCNPSERIRKQTFDHQ